MLRSLKALSRSHKDQATYLVLFGALFPLFFVAAGVNRAVHLGKGGDRTVYLEAKDRTSVAVAYAFMG